MGGRPSWQDGVCEGLTEAEIRARPGGSNSIAWLLWHITRIEDLIVNVALRDQRQVIDEPHWLAELGVDRAAIGTGMLDDKVADWSARLDLAALRGYRAEVGRRTRSWVSDGGLDFVEPELPVRERLTALTGTFDEGSIELIDFWSSIGTYLLVATPVLAHQALHLGEARVVRSHVLDLRRGGA